MAPIDAPGPCPGDPAPAFRLRRTFETEVALEEHLRRRPAVLAS